MLPSMQLDFARAGRVGARDSYIRCAEAAAFIPREIAGRLPICDFALSLEPRL